MDEQELQRLIENRQAHDRLLSPDMARILEVLKMGKDKTGARFHDGVYDAPRFYSMKSEDILLGSEKTNFFRVRNLIVQSALKDGFCGSLNDRAPEVSRLFIDIDVNKHDGDVEITDEDMVTFGKKFNVVKSKKEFFNYPDPTPQIHVGGSDFQWFTHPGAEQELNMMAQQ